MHSCPGQHARSCLVADWVYDTLMYTDEDFYTITCVSSPPQSIILPICFGALGIYIAIEAAKYYNLTFQKIMLNWEQYAIRGLSMWIIFSLSYTTFVFVVRLLITVCGMLLSSPGCPRIGREFGYC